MLIAMMAMLLMTALGVTLILTSSSESLIAAHFLNSVEARYAAHAIVERAMDDLVGAADWAVVLDGSTQSAWVDGAPAGVRTLADGSIVDLTQVVNLANCQKTTACSLADLNATTADRPWGANNPRWKPYAYGALRDLIPASHTIDSACYVVLLVGNGPPAVQGWEIIALRAEAFAPRGAHKVIEVTAGRAVGNPGEEKDYNDDPGQAGMKVLSWREVR